MIARNGSVEIKRREKLHCSLLRRPIIEHSVNGRLTMTESLFAGRLKPVPQQNRPKPDLGLARSALQ
jgi:hypothetical protein